MYIYIQAALASEARALRDTGVAVETTRLSGAKLKLCDQTKAAGEKELAALKLESTELLSSATRCAGDACLSFCLSVSLHHYIHIYLSIYLSVYLSIYLYLYIYVYKVYTYMCVHIYIYIKIKAFHIPGWLTSCNAWSAAKCLYKRWVIHVCSG